MVGSDTPEARARARCSQRNKARAARISSLVMASESNLSGIDLAPTGHNFDTPRIDNAAIQGLEYRS